MDSYIYRENDEEFEYYEPEIYLPPYDYVLKSPATTYVAFPKTKSQRRKDTNLFRKGEFGRGTSVYKMYKNLFARPRSPIPRTHWRIVSAAVIERLPLIKPEPTKEEVEYKMILDHKAKIKKEISDREQQQLLGMSELADDEHEFEGLEKDEERERITEDDRKNNVRSLDRKLAERLYLIVKKQREQHAWQFPQGGWEKNESLYRTAKREVLEECGPDLRFHMFVNQPIGHMQYLFPEKRSNSDQI